MRLRQLLFAASTRFLPAVVVIAATVLIVEPILRGHGVIATLSHVYLPLAIGEPLLFTVGAVAALWLLRRQLEAGVLLSVGRNAVAAVVTVAAMMVISVFSQGANLPLIISASLLAGAFGALVAFPAARTTVAIA
jgi:hypothetical protein